MTTGDQIQIPCIMMRGGTSRGPAVRIHNVNTRKLFEGAVFTRRSHMPCEIKTVSGIMELGSFFTQPASQPFAARPCS